MTNKVFVDTGGWLGCINKKDDHHHYSIEYFMKLKKNNVPMVTSNYIMSETLTWLNYNQQHDTAVKVMNIWKEAEHLNDLSVYWVDKAIVEDAWNIFQKFSDQRLSFTDCTSFTICRKLEIDKVFSFDNHFNTLGFLLSPYQVQEKGATYDVLRP